MFSVQRSQISPVLPATPGYVIMGESPRGGAKRTGKTEISEMWATLG